MALSIEQLYEAYMDIGEFSGEAAQDFAYDIYDWFGGEESGKTKEEWARDYGFALPVYDPTGEYIAKEDMSLALVDAFNVNELTKDIQDTVYSTSMEELTKEAATSIGKSKEIAGGIGLKTGSLETALEDTLGSTIGKVKSLEDRFAISKQGTKDSYNKKVVGATLDYEKDILHEKEEFYDRVMKMVNKISQTGAFDEGDCETMGNTLCWDGSCVEDAAECPLQSMSDLTVQQELDGELGNNLENCAGQCLTGLEICVDGVCLSQYSLDIESEQAECDALCGPGNKCTDEGCVPDAYADSGTDYNFIPGNCPTGTIWNTEADGCIGIQPPINPGDPPRLSCTGKCGWFMMFAEAGWSINSRVMVTMLQHFGTQKGYEWLRGFYDPDPGDHDRSRAGFEKEVRDFFCGFLNWCY